MIDYEEVVNILTEAERIDPDVKYEVGIRINHPRGYLHCYEESPYHFFMTREVDNKMKATKFLVEGNVSTEKLIEINFGDFGCVVLHGDRTFISEENSKSLQKLIDYISREYGWVKRTKNVNL